MLTADKTRLKIFDDGIIINKDLPKWKNSKGRLHIKREAEAKKRAEGGDGGTIYFTQSQPMSVTSASSSLTTNPFNEMNSPVSFSDYGQEEFNKADFDGAAKMSIKDLTDFINEKGSDIIYGRSFISNNQMDASGGNGPDVKPGFFQRLLNRITKNKEEVYSIDVVSFFEHMKTIGKGSVDTYKDRVEKYLSALRTATITGQVSLKEKLAREMFVNKYEAELYANGLYYVIDEDKVVEFAKKTEKGVSLIYLKNFARPLPDKVVKVLTEVDSLEVFDNYAVMCYDPEGKKKVETEEERVKRKDPILFGLISGSNKLYYITDWVDDYCNLTLQQFVDTLKIEKKDLKMK